ncbi:MAG: DUF58 domain-containing protein [Clostridia bacterium]|nr:DUF58 domain-containing protein [Clostridia bacterium]
MKARLIGFLVVIAALMLAALSTGAQMYYALAITMIAVVALALASVVWTMLTLKVGIKGLARQVERGSSLTVALSVRYACPLPVSEIRIVIAAPASGRKPQELTVAAVPFVRRNYRHVIRCPHRGDFEAGVVRLTVTDMFGLFSISRRENRKLVKVEVRPKVTETSPLILKPVEAGPESILRTADDTASPVDIRKWQDGDELKRVHWKLTMRKREVMVKVFEASGKPDMLVIPDLSAISALPDQALTFEDGIVEATIAMAKAQLDNGYPVRMPLVNAQPLELSASLPQEVERIAEQLTHVAFDSSYSFEQVLMTMNSRLGRTGGLALITAKLSVRIADMAIRMRGLGLNVRVVWVTDDRRPEQMQLIARMGMSDVSTTIVDPFVDVAPFAAPIAQA